MHVCVYEIDRKTDTHTDRLKVVSMCISASPEHWWGLKGHAQKTAGVSKATHPHPRARTNAWWYARTHIQVRAANTKSTLENRPVQGHLSVTHFIQSLSQIQSKTL